MRKLIALSIVFVLFVLVVVAPVIADDTDRVKAMGESASAVEIKAPPSPDHTLSWAFIISAAVLLAVVWILVRRPRRLTYGEQILAEEQRKKKMGMPLLLLTVLAAGLPLPAEAFMQMENQARPTLLGLSVVAWVGLFIIALVVLLIILSVRAMMVPEPPSSAKK